ncbi:RICIN domain-containing protein [Streptomyces formicae]|nr:RICIN domain-containing protein [Streptomyces formicae]
MISGLCLDIEGGGTAAGTPVEVYDCHGGANQQWRYQSGTLRNPASGRCLEPVGALRPTGRGCRSPTARAPPLSSGRCRSLRRRRLPGVRPPRTVPPADIRRWG